MSKKRRLSKTLFTTARTDNVRIGLSFDSTRELCVAIVERAFEVNVQICATSLLGSLSGRARWIEDAQDAQKILPGDTSLDLRTTLLRD